MQLWFGAGWDLGLVMLLLHLLRQLLQIPLELIDNAQVIVPRRLQDFRLGLALEQRVLQLLAMRTVGGNGDGGGLFVLQVFKMQLKGTKLVCIRAYHGRVE